MPRTINPTGIRRNNTTIETDALGRVNVTLHKTCIATLSADGQHVYLHTGGYDTPTTFRRMNECLHHWGFPNRVGVADFRNADTLQLTKKG